AQANMPGRYDVMCPVKADAATERGDARYSLQVTVSAINRNYKGRSGPGRLYLASPLSVAASAFTGHITSYRPGMFACAPTDPHSADAPSADEVAS
ncbi:MAG: hypothetical protein AAGD06_17590, partial [Acidobacteriota bacterium]